MKFKKLLRKLCKKASFGNYLSLLITSTILFMISFHNVDWSQNMERLNIHMYYATNMTERNFFKDASVTGKLWEYGQAYSIGMIIMILSMLIFGYSIYKIGRKVGDKRI